MMREVPNFCITTSSIDKEYYVIDENIKDMELFMLANTLKLNDDVTYTNIILNYFHLKQDIKKINLFIKKDSNLGRLISHLILLEKIVDKSNYISKETLLNALINEIEKDQIDDVFLKDIYKMIKRREYGSKESLLVNYDEELLDRIIIQGRCQGYYPLLNDKARKENKDGYLYDEQLGWCFFDIETKKLSQIEEMTNKRNEKNIYEVINIIPKKTKKRTKTNINDIISILARKSK